MKALSKSFPVITNFNHSFSNWDCFLKQRPVDEYQKNGQFYWRYGYMFFRHYALKPSILGLKVSNCVILLIFDILVLLKVLLVKENRPARLKESIYSQFSISDLRRDSILIFPLPLRAWFWKTSSHVIYSWYGKGSWWYWPKKID